MLGILLERRFFPHPHKRVCYYFGNKWVISKQSFKVCENNKEHKNISIPNYKNLQRLLFKVKSFVKMVAEFKVID